MSDAGWDTTEQGSEEARRMAYYVRLAERDSQLADQRCATCAFRPGTEANRSARVLEMVEHALLMHGIFGCHVGHVPVAGGYVVRRPGRETKPDHARPNSPLQLVVAIPDFCDRQRRNPSHLVFKLNLCKSVKSVDEVLLLSSAAIRFSIHVICGLLCC